MFHHLRASRLVTIAQIEDRVRAADSEFVLACQLRFAARESAIFGAPVTLVEYGDYECPYCGAAYPVLKDIQAQMGDGLRFVFRNFPITSSHAHAE